MSPIAAIGPILDLVNLGLAVTITSIGFVAAKKSHGALKFVWNMVILTAVALGVHELQGYIESTGILSFLEWFNAWETVTLVCLAIAAGALQRVHTK